MESKYHKKLLIAVTPFVVVAIGAFYFGKYYLPTSPTPSDRPQEQVSVPDYDPKNLYENIFPSFVNRKLTPEEYKAYVNELKILVREQNPKKALEYLQQLALEKKVGRDCHNLTHEIGYAAYEKYKDPIAALEYKLEVCGFGYIHGVVSSYVVGSPRPIESMTEICKRYPEGRDALECYHAIGHATMIYSGNDLPGSLKQCENYPDDVANRSCGLGVFMENFASDEDHVSDYAKKDDPLYPCSEQSEHHKSYCYKMAPTYYLRVHEDDFSGILAWCNTAEAKYRSWCVRGATRSFIQYDSKIVNVEQFCMSGTPDQIDPCIREMVQLTLQIMSREETKDICESKLVYPANQEICVEASDTEQKIL